MRNRKTGRRLWACLPALLVALLSQWPVFAAEPVAAAGKPADFRSQNFLVHTDVPPAEAKALLERLETMLKLISGYWGREPSGIIECYIVRDLANWPDGAMPAGGVAKIREGAGVTISESLRSANTFVAKATVYSVADIGVPQHEAVHAYCQQTFGSVGPLWYAEGMAEMGQYWREGNLEVSCHPGVLEHIQKAQPKRTMREILDTNRQAGDTWENYAWRWALCHLLANNPNYKAQFRPLGVGLLLEQAVSFEETYGAVADQISFEYDFFLNHIDRGYRVDLCAWDWKRKFATPPPGGTPIAAKVKAAAGWQPSGATLTAGTPYAYTASGTWQTAKDAKPVAADGGDKGKKNAPGRLVGIIMRASEPGQRFDISKPFELSEPFDLSEQGTFTPTSHGRLFLRCFDQWNELADNSGTVSFKLKLAAVGDPLPTPMATKPR